MDTIFTNTILTEPIIKSEGIIRTTTLKSNTIEVFDDVERYLKYLEINHTIIELLVIYNSENYNEVLYGLHQNKYISEFKISKAIGAGYIYTLEHIYEIDENTKVKIMMQGVESMDSNSLEVLIKNKNLQKVF